MKMKKVVIIGMGLIGGSIGKALIKRGLADEVVGVCRRQSSLDRAVNEKALTKGFVNSYAEAVSGADMVIIATPVHAVMEVLDGLAEVLTDGRTLVTDVGSTKEEIIEYASKYSGKFKFVGAHPLAGSEKTGPENSTDGLFEGSVCVVTNGSKEAEILEAFWESLGATVIVMDPKEHDRNLALSSHLPHVVAFALAGILGERVPKEMFATGFKDTTRIGASDPLLWSDILLTNRDNVLKAIEKYKAILELIEKDIEASDQDALKKRLKDYKDLRDGIV